VEDKDSIFELIAVVDGDTIRIDYRGKPTYVRLLRINTPEVGRRGYEEATESLRALVGEGPVRIVSEIPGRIETDHYGRLLAYVYVGDLNVNLEIVRRGWSKFWPIFGEGRFAESFRKAQKEAQESTAGLWGQSGER
jgi:micrococcal nuclease